MPRRLCVLFSCAILFMYPSRAYSQAVKGTLLGTVTDASGATIPSAKISIVEINTGISRTLSTNERGVYVFANLEAGTYRVVVEQPGFQKADRDRVAVEVNTTVRVDFELQPGNVTEVVTVSSETPLLQTDRSDTGRKLETRIVAEMPMGFNRNFQSLLNLVPGVKRAYRPHSEFFNSADTLSSEVHGLNRLVNNVQVEGVDNNHRSGLLTTLIPPAEAIATVDISTSNYEAELGRAAGVVTNVTLKSGTNSFHGSAFEFLRVSRLDARPVFAAVKAPTTYNMFGFTFGGPIRKNQTFFFGDYQGIRDRRGDVNIATIPTMTYRTGDLSEGLRLPGQLPQVVFDPLTGNPDGTLRQPFSGNIIPSSRISPIARRLLDMIAPPVRPGFNSNYERNTVREKDTEAFDAKLDHQFDENNRLSFRYGYQRPKVFDPPLYGLQGGPSKNQGFAGVGTNRIQSTAVNYTHLFSPTFITELRIGVSRYRNEAYNADYGTNASENVGIPGANISDFTTGLSQILINGYTASVLGYHNSLPWQRAETNFNYVSNWTKIKSTHTIKWGGEFRVIRDDLNQNDVYGARGRFEFREGTTGLNVTPRRTDIVAGFTNAFASFLLDRPNFLGRSVPYIFPAFRQKALYLYVQDKWQATPKLTIDFGVRHEFYRSPRPRFAGGMANYDPESNSVLVAGIGANPLNMGRQENFRHFAPRFGIAYRVNDKTVLRGGFGISTNPSGDGNFFNYGYNFPVKTTEAYNALDAFSVAGSMATGFPAPPPRAYGDDGIIRNAPLTQNFTQFLPDLTEGYVESWNIAVQRSLPWQFVFEAAYVGNQAVRLQTYRDINASRTLGSGAAGQPYFQKFGRTASISGYQPTNSNYHSLQAKLDRRLATNFLLTTAYTYSRQIDVDFYQQIDISLNRARGGADRTHIFVQSYIYELPFGRTQRWLRSGPASWILGGWQITGIFTAMTGLALNITGGGILNTPGSSNRPNINGKPEIYGLVGPGQKWLDVSKFSDPGVGVLGNTGRNILSGPGFINLDFSVFRRFTITERFRLELRGESFNVSNTPHFANPNMAFGSASFGEISGADNDFTDPASRRQIQLGIKLTF